MPKRYVVALVILFWSPSWTWGR